MKTFRFPIYFIPLLSLCSVMQTLAISAQSYNVEPLKIGKSSDQVFAGDCYNGKLFFCSNAKAKKAKHVVNEDDSRFLNLYQISISQDHKISKKEKPEILSENINSDLNEGPIFFDKKTGEAYFSSNVKSDSTAISLALYYSKYDPATGTFVKRSKIIIDLGDGNYSNPTLSADGSKMIFSFTGLTDSTSNLYLSEKINDKWSTPLKLSNLCTDYSETFPRWYENTLYFVSNRPGGIGGLDIYKSIYFDGKFGTPKLLPQPINSSADDFLFIEVTGNHGFFSSNRLQGKDKVFRFELDMPSASEFIESNIDFCFTMQDEVILDKAYYDYIWEFGDGTKQNGAIVEHCYKDTGIYELSCHLLNIETLEIEENIINAPIKVVAEYPIIEHTSLNDQQLEFHLNQQWSRRNYKNHYWILNGDIITEPSFKINPNGSKPIEIKVVLWNADNPGDVVGIVKTIIPDK